MADNVDEANPPEGSREARAKRYLEQDLRGQRQWYSTKSSAYKQRAQLLGLFIIAAGAATTFLQVFTPALWVPILTALLGASIAITWQRIARYGESWMAYRNASQRMKREPWQNRASEPGGRQQDRRAAGEAETGEAGRV